MDVNSASTAEECKDRCIVKTSQTSHFQLLHACIFLVLHDFLFFPQGSACYTRQYKGSHWPAQQRNVVTNPPLLSIVNERHHKRSPSIPVHPLLVQLKWSTLRQCSPRTIKEFGAMWFRYLTRVTSRKLLKLPDACNIIYHTPLLQLLLSLLLLLDKYYY